ncbi:LuxR C-terminal-related transcriptional regulator [Arthrobacter sp. Bz4]|uniref:helix-turn-helix transcriptional regulator n=1 Tax=Arthrobacter sp. Bz4 TaxID=2171979 RepID=UPI0010571DAC|nr:LuxR C-terminal-related transcriptional regulator [Arthrobacter sp. Bz4]
MSDREVIDLGLLDAPDRARFHLAAAREAARVGHGTAAAVELSKSRAYLLHWPGRIASSLDQVAATILDTPSVTPAQQKVLNLLLEGLSNEDIAHQLRISPRTVAVHVQALLRNTAARSRTDLAVRELRRRFTALNHA